VNYPPTVQYVFATMMEIGGEGYETREDGTKAEKATCQEEEDLAGAVRVIPPSVLPHQSQGRGSAWTLDRSKPFHIPGDEIYGTFLSTPITLERIKEVTKLYGTRREM
jgi:hypothetical protein